MHLTLSSRQRRLLGQCEHSRRTSAAGPRNSEGLPLLARLNWLRRRVVSIIVIAELFSSFLFALCLVSGNNNNNAELNENDDDGPRAVALQSSSIVSLSLFAGAACKLA